MVILFRIFISIGLAFLFCSVGRAEDTHAHTGLPSQRHLTRTLTPIEPCARGKIYEFLQKPDGSEEFLQAAEAVRRLSPDEGYEYTPRILERLKTTTDTRTKQQCLMTVEALTPTVLADVQRLTELLDDPDMNVQIWACKVLAKMGRLGRVALPRLVRLANEGVLSVRTNALITIGGIAPRAAENPQQFNDIIDLLVKKLDGFYQIEKSRALEGLGKLGPEAKAATKKIRELMEDETKSVQPEAAYAYWKITGDSNYVMRKMGGYLLDPNHSDYPTKTMEFIQKMGSVARPVGPTLQSIIDNKEKDEIQRAEARRTLNKIR